MSCRDNDQLRKEAEAWAEQEMLDNPSGDRQSLIAGYLALGQQLKQAAPEFDEAALAEFAGYHSVDIPQLHGTECPALFEYAKRIARWQFEQGRLREQALRHEMRMQMGAVKERDAALAEVEAWKDRAAINGKRGFEAMDERDRFKADYNEQVRIFTVSAENWKRELAEAEKKSEERRLVILDVSAELTAERERVKGLISVCPELLRAWDELGEHKDDDFGTVQMQMEKLRMAFAAYRGETK